MKKQSDAVINALVIDDNEVNTMILTNMLELFGIHTDQTFGGRKAVLLTKKKTFDIIFIDHIMPEMDGIQTTAAIRNSSLDNQRSVIIALTSTITEELRNRYIEVGANDLYIKPLSLLNLVSVLKKWFPKVQIDTVPLNQEMHIFDQKNESIRTFLKNLNDIDFAKGLSYAIGNPVQYMNILEVSLKDLQSCINIIVNSYENNSVKQLQMEVHKLKNIFSNIGATGLSEKTELFEKTILQGEVNNMKLQYDSFVNRLEGFKESLKEAIKKYHISIKSMVKDQEPVFAPMSKTEYEQCLLNTIYYIRRYEYDSIAKELERLILQGSQEWKQEFELAFKDIKDYNYEKALSRIMSVKNETGNLPIPEIKNNIKLKSFWD